jgi:hypothetical protein
VLTDRYANKIIKYLNNPPIEFYRNKRGWRTKYIKATLAILGHSEYYRVYTNSIHPDENEEIYKLVRERIKISNSHFQNFRKCFRDKEWLFDIHWYRERGDKYGKFKKKSNTVLDHYITSNLKLAAECEWGQKRRKDPSNVLFGAVKYDFLKLLVTNAKLRLLIFNIRPNDSKDKLRNFDRYLKKAIQTYGHLKPGDSFLFIAYCKSEQKVIFKQIVKR